MKSLKLGYDTQNSHYLVHLLSKQGLKPDPKYSGSPKYLKYWAMDEAGRLLGQDVTQWESQLKKEIQRLDEAQITLAQFKKEQADKMERIKNDPAYRALLAAQAEIDDALYARISGDRH